MLVLSNPTLTALLPLLGSDADALLLLSALGSAGFAFAVGLGLATSLGAALVASLEACFAFAVSFGAAAGISFAAAFSAFSALAVVSAAASSADLRGACQVHGTRHTVHYSVYVQAAGAEAQQHW